MGQTISEKIFSSHVRHEVTAGDILFAPLDLMMSNDASFPLVLEALRKIKEYGIRDPQKLILILDHYCPSPSPEVSRIHEEIKAFARRFGSTLYAEGEGVCHQLVPEKGHVRPGHLVIGSDSHTTTYGALNAFATGVGSTDMAVAIHYGLLWFKVPSSIRVAFSGRIPKGVYAKDISLHYVSKLTARGANGLAVEFSGDALEQLSLEGRLTICNMVMETGAKAGIMPADRVCRDWLKERGVVDISHVAPDRDAAYVREYSFDVSSLEPQVALPHQVDNVRSISEVQGEKIGMAFLGTCTNGRLEDLAVAAQILKGKRIPPGVVLVVAPASREVLLEACKRGYIQTLVESGGMVDAPGCGPCVGALGGVPADGVNVISTANRNFIGRMGNVKASIFLASPATVASSCLTGRITDPREFL